MAGPYSPTQVFVFLLLICIINSPGIHLSHNVPVYLAFQPKAITGPATKGSVLLQ